MLIERATPQTLYELIVVDVAVMLVVLEITFARIIWPEGRVHSSGDHRPPRRLLNRPSEVPWQCES